MLDKMESGGSCDLLRFSALSARSNRPGPLSSDQLGLVGVVTRSTGGDVSNDFSVSNVGVA